MHVLCFKFPEYLLRKVLRLGVEVSLVLDSYDINNESYTEELLSECMSVHRIADINSMEELAGIFTHIKFRLRVPVDHVLNGAEYSTFGSGFIKSLLLGNFEQSRLALNSRNKRAMKNAFSAANLEYSRPRSFAGLETSDFPLVVKPVAGTGSFNTTRVDSEEELVSFIRETDLHPALSRQEWLLEDYSNGDEYHVDTIWRDGSPIFTSVGKYLTPRMLTVESPELNGSVIISPITEAQLYDSIISDLRRLSISLGLSSGVTHIEVFIDDNGRRIYGEVGTRFAGSSIPQAIDAAFGIDFIEEWMRAELELPSLLPQDVYEKYATAGHLCVCPSSSGRIVELGSDEDYLSLDGVVYCRSHKSVGDWYDSNNPSDWCVLIAIQAQNYSNFMNTCDFVLNQLPIVTK